MALYAVDEDDLISAWDAEKKTVYWCLECFGPVKLRKGKNRFPHFYHLTISPSCRLYSKSEDHLLLQLQLQKSFPPGEIRIESPLFKINRVADLLWEKKKIAFEIQCSSLYAAEAESRIDEYKTAGYDIVWILDDRIFNKRQLRPAEEFLRSRLAFFATFRRLSPSHFYDQFEIFFNKKRIKKGRKIAIDLSKAHPLLPTQWPSELPSQIAKRIAHSLWYFEKDLIYRTLRFPSFKGSLQNWRALEIHLQKSHTAPNLTKRLFYRFIRDPYLAGLESLLYKNASKSEIKSRMDKRGEKQLDDVKENSKWEENPICQVKS